MPYHNRFRHQTYTSEAYNYPFELLSPPPLAPLDAEVSRLRLQVIGAALQRAGVRAIYLLHGTFVGTDALGLIRGVTRAWPALADVLYRKQKRALDTFVGDAGNFSPRYAAELERTINCDSDGLARIPVRLFDWSSENHHVGRADGAVRLIDELASHPELHGFRVLLCGHSHGGNVLALVSNLVGNDCATNRSFFDAARVYYRWPVWGRTDIESDHGNRGDVDRGN